MADLDLATIEARARAALTYERSIYDAAEGMYEPADGREPPEEIHSCPLCAGDGEVTGQRFDDTSTKASTIVAYGIGEGLGLAEAFVAHAAADTLALLSRLAAAEAERDEAREALRPFATMAAQFDKPARLSARDDEDQIYTVDFVPGVDPATIRVGDIRAARRALGGRS